MTSHIYGLSRMQRYRIVGGVSDKNFRHYIGIKVVELELGISGHA